MRQEGYVQVLWLLAVTLLRLPALVKSFSQYFCLSQTNRSHVYILQINVHKLTTDNLIVIAGDYLWI